MRPLNPRDFLDQRYYGNPVHDWLVAAAVLVVATVFLYVLRRLLVRRLEGIALRTATDIDDLGIDLIRRTRPYFIIGVALALATVAVDVPVQWQRTRHVLLVLVAVLQAGVWGNGIVSFWVTRHLRKSGRTGPAATTLTALGVLARVFVWTLLGLVALDNMGIEISTIVTGLGIGGIAIALAVQNILGDLFGALSIVIDKPFVVGDYIVVDGYQGTVEHIGLKTTRLRSLGGEQIVIGNTDLLKSRIRNYQGLQERRHVFRVSVPHDTPPDGVERIPAMIREAVVRHEKVRFDRAHFQRFTESALDFETVYFYQDPDYNRFMDTQQAINLEILRRLESEGIGLASPVRSVVVRNGDLPASAKLG